MRRRTVVLLAIIVIIISIGAFIYVQRTAPTLPIGGLGLSPTDFLGAWINVKDMPCQCQAEQAIINGLEISENQGTYTIYVVLSGEGSTVILTVNPPNAHAFIIFQAQGGLSINADLTLQLLNSTFMQVKESIDYASNLSTTSLLATEQFVKWSGSFSTQSTTSQTREQVILEAYNFPSGGPLTVTLRNVGSAPENLATADYFVNGVVGTGTGCPSALTPSQSCVETVTVATGSLISGVAYPFKIVTPTGGVFSYSVIYGGSG